MELFETIHNVVTGEITKRPYTKEEIEQYEKNKIEIDKEIEQRKQAEAEAAAKRQALLTKLGITEDEARLLLGGN